MNNVAINSQDPNAQNQNGNQSGQQQGQGNNGPQQPNAAQQGQNGNANQSPSAMHTAFQNGVDGDGGSGGRIARQEDTYDGDYGTDMNKIVADALRAAEDSLVEEAEATLVQADWEDLCQRQKEEEENNGYDAKAAQAVADYYKTINPNKRGGHQWNVPFQRCRYDLPKVQAPTSIKLEAKKLNQEFSKILLSKASFDSFNRRRGLLDTNGLHKLVGLKQDDIFMKKGNPRTADYVFYVLMDGSGSMSGTKFNEALRACALIEESLKGIAQVKIVVFDFYYDKVRHHVVKEFKEIPYNNSWAYANSRHASGCNMDGFSIRVAKNELLKRPEQNKILITLSDGQPNGPSAYSGTRGENDVSEAVLETRKKGIHVFNIFFGESKSERDRYLPSFKHMYRDKGIISCAPSAIGTELLRIVRRELC
jgi:cobalamin biosynthesis protein CobT